MDRYVICQNRKILIVEYQCYYMGGYNSFNFPVHLEFFKIKHLPRQSWWASPHPTLILESALRKGTKQ